MVINVCEKLRKTNMLYVKVIQWNLHDYFNIYDDELKEYFSRFSNSVPYTSEDIDYDLIRKIETQFDYKLHFDKTPINSGTTALVFKGTLDNKDVAIKLLRKGIHSIINTDIENIKDTLNNVMYLLSFFYDTNKNIIKIININTSLLLDQCDLSKEVNNLKIFRDLLIDNESIMVPQVYAEFTEFSNQIMVMEYLDGTPVVSVDSKTLEKYADIVIGYIFISYLSSNPIHADLHPGNVLLLKNGRIGIIDFGIVVEMTTLHANNMLKVFLAISNSNFNLLVDSLTDSFTNKTEFDIDKDKIRNIIEVALYEIKDDMFHKTNKLNMTNLVKAFRQIIINVQDCNIDPKSLQVILSFVSSIYTIDKFSLGEPLSTMFAFFMGSIA